MPDICGYRMAYTGALPKFPLVAPSVSALWLLAGCAGGDSDDNGGGTAAGTVSEMWQAYCVATVTRDHPVTDDFGDPLFTLHAGEEYLLTEYGDAFGESRADLVYITATGPYDFRITLPAGSQDFPFTSNCEFGNNVSHYAVFNDVNVYSDVALTMQICALAAGAVVPLNGMGSGYAAAGDSFSFSGPTKYQVQLAGFSAQCGGATSGYISVPQTEVFGITTWLVPIIKIIGPA